MFPKAHDPKHVKLLCTETFNGSMGSVPVRSFGVLVQATSKVTVLAVKQLSAEKLEMIPTASSPFSLH